MRRRYVLPLALLVGGLSVSFLWAATTVESPPAGWILTGSMPQAYEVGVDTAVRASGDRSGFLRSTAPSPEGFGTLMQEIQADPYHGKRVRLSAAVRADQVEQWAGLWMRVDGRGQETLRFDNMQQRPIRTSGEWKRFEVVLDVPEEAVGIAYGILLAGAGHVRLDDVRLEEVDESVPTTGGAMPQRPERKRAAKSVNLDFEQ